MNNSSAPELALDALSGSVWVLGKKLRPFSEEDYAILLCLVQNGNRTVTRSELAAAAWPENPDDVPSSEITRCIRRLRGRTIPIRTRRAQGGESAQPSQSVDGYIIPFAYESLEINEVMRREFGPQNLSINFASKEVWVKGEKLSPLPVDEYNILEFLTLNRGRTTSYSEFSMSLLGLPKSFFFDPMGSIREWKVRESAHVDSIVQRLRDKIEENPKKPRIVLRRFGYGYIIPVRDQVVPHDEGPGPVEVAVKESIRDIGNVLGFIFWATIIAVGLVLFYLLLMILAPI